MKTIRSIFFLIILICVLALPVVWADESSQLLTDVSQKLSLVESKLKQLSASQSQIIQKHEEINTELDSLRIWIRRHRG